MIAVLASRFDEPVRRAVESWRSPDAVLLTVDDVLTAGWSVPTRDILNSSFVAEGRIRLARQLTAVINVMSQVHDFEMLGIYRRDRAYVSAEAFAFLVWWLHALPCPVLNRPTPGCLNGPAWRQEQWARACRRAEIPVLPVRGNSTALPAPFGAYPPVIHTTTVVGKRTYGDVYARECLTLSSLAGTQFLDVFFRKASEDWVFVGVNLIPRIQRAEVRKMLDDMLMEWPIESDCGVAMGIAGG